MPAILTDLLKDSAYRLDQFQPAAIAALEAAVTLKASAKVATPYVNCLVRGKPIKLTPEEVVRQLYVAWLLADNNQLSIKVAKYAGADKCDLVENEEYGFCSLVKATHQVLDKLNLENRTLTRITGAAEREQRRLVDERALREAVINAMVHNDFSAEVPPVVEIFADRISITSYGGLVSGLSRDEFLAGRSMPRNRELMRVFRDLDLVEQLGSGVHRILSVYDASVFHISEHRNNS